MSFRGFFRRKRDRKALVKLVKQNYCSFYDSIVKDIQENGELSASFSLPDPLASPNKIEMADGALDGIRVYHMAGGEVYINDLTEVLKQASLGEFDKAEASLMTFFAEENAPLMLSCIDDLVQWVIDNQRQLDTRALYEFSAKLITSSSDKESIKFALSVLELLYETVEKDGALRKIILELALSDEFTLFVIFVVREFENGNQEVVEMAKKVHGWGRIQAIDFIVPDSLEIQNWLLTEGFKNEILSEYSASSCIEKGQLLERLTMKNIELKQATAIHQLMAASLQEGPVAIITSYDYGEKLLDSYLQWVEDLVPSVAMLETLLTMKVGLADCKWLNRDNYLSQCDALIQKQSSKAVVIEAISQGTGFYVAKKLGIDCDSDIMNAIRNDFDTNYYLCGYLFEKGIFVDELIKIFEDELPLMEIATGPSDSLGLGSGYKKYQQLESILPHLMSYPGKGEKLLCAALRSPVTHNRQLALDLLDEWQRIGEGLSANVLADIEKLKETEVVEEIKMRLNK